MYAMWSKDRFRKAETIYKFQWEESIKTLYKKALPNRYSPAWNEELLSKWKMS